MWQEYSAVFRDFDDLTLARWLCQTLGQMQDRAWRLSHPLLAAYRLGAQVANDREIWSKRLATSPPAYADAPCCRAPLVPLFTRDVVESGLICLHCGETAVDFENLPEDLREDISLWGEEYEPIHEVAHWDDAQRKRIGHYEQKFEEAGDKVAGLLAYAGKQFIPRLLESYAAVVWEDQDECLDVLPEDIKF